MEQLKLIKKGAIFFAILLAFAASGCKAPGEVQVRQNLELPSEFGVVTDSGSIADLPWHQLFTDPYLQRLIDSALTNSFDLKSTMERIEISRAAFRQTLAPLRPSVSAVITGGVERLSPNSFNRLNNPNSSLVTDIFAGFQSSWELDIWNRLGSLRTAAMNRFIATEEEMHLMKTMLVSEVARNYYNLLTLDRELSIVNRNIELQKNVVEIIGFQKQGGRATELAVQQSRAQLLSTQGLAVDYRQQILQTENQINTLMGRLPQPVSRADSLPEDFLLTSTRIGVPSDLLLRRPDLLQAERELAAVRADIGAARAAFFPALTLTPFAGVNALSPGKLVNPSSLAVGVAAGLTAPIFNRIRIQSEYDRALASRNETYYNYQQAIVTSYTEVVNNLNRIHNLKNRLKLLDEETKSLREAVSISKDLYLAGYATYLEVIVAQENVLEAELELVNNQNDLYSSQIDLYRSLGGGWKD